MEHCLICESPDHETEECPNGSGLEEPDNTW